MSRSHSNRARSSSPAKPLAAAVFSIALVAVMSGCSTPWSAGSGSQTPSNAAYAGNRDSQVPDSPQETYVKQAESDVLPVNSAPADEPFEADIASNAAAGKKPDKSGEPEAKWSAELPQLRGLSIGATQEAVIRTYGQPGDEYNMEAGSDRLQVMEYDGFTFGFSGGRIQFIEVYGTELSTGLNGLRIGDGIDTAIDKLGKPDRNTGFVLSYLADDATLKLDLDPKTQQILSVKLFAAIA